MKLTLSRLGVLVGIVIGPAPWKAPLLTTSLVHCPHLLNSIHVDMHPARHYRLPALGVASLWTLVPLGVTTPMVLTTSSRLMCRSPCVAMSMCDLSDDVNVPQVFIAPATVDFSPAV